MAACIFALLCVLPGEAISDPAGAGGESVDSAALVVRLYDRLDSGAGSDASLSAILKTASQDDRNWPVITYLVAENQLQQGKIAAAASTFRALASRAANQEEANANPEGWGTSGLATVALWRWLKLLQDRDVTAEEVGAAMEVASGLQQTRFFNGMVSPSLLPALPLMEEDIARMLAHLAWRTKREEAASLFLDFVSINSSGVLDPVDDEIMQSMISRGLAVRERLDLFRLRRQLSYVRIKAQKDETAAQLLQLWENQAAPDDVRAEAGYEWAYYYRYSKDRKARVISVLTSAFNLLKERGLIAQKALFLRAKVQNSVSPRQPELFVADLNKMLELFPRSRLIDDVYYQLATEYLFGEQQHIDLALADFAKLRQFEGSNDWLDSAYFLAAIAHMDRGDKQDFDAADKLLEEYVRLFPDGPFRLRCLFWRGRLAERAGHEDAAKQLFMQVQNEAPYSYYGLRAAMHMENGADAASMTLPARDSALHRHIAEAYRQNGPNAGLKGVTAFHSRLADAAQDGLYQRLYSIVGGIGKQFRNRLDNIDLQELDDAKLIPSVALLLAYRQDAFAARDINPVPDNQLRLATLFGNRMGDWTTAISMTFASGISYQRTSELQHDARYLRAVYPDIDKVSDIETPLRQAAWNIDGSGELSESLMYAVIRRESAFFSGAISSVGALGLFQVMPYTFNARPDCWKMWNRTSDPTPPAYLFNPARNIQFWSCWVGKEFRPDTGSEIAEMLVKHHAGAGNLHEWKRTWKGRIMENDLEMQIDTYRFAATQLFVRNVLTDMILVDASNIFDKKNVVRLEGSNE